MFPRHRFSAFGQPVSERRASELGRAVVCAGAVGEFALVLTDVVDDLFDRGQTDGPALSLALGLVAADAVAGIDANRFPISEQRAQLVELARFAAAGNSREGHGKINQKEGGALLTPAALATWHYFWFSQS